MLESFFLHGPIPANAEAGTYQFPLVALSYIVASFASFTALMLAQQIVSTHYATARRWLHWGGAFAMGAGIWSMHFIGMLSYRMRMAMEYDPWLTLFSMVIAIGVAYGVLLIVTRERLSIGSILVGAVLLGAGICGMHYTGMAAMRMDAKLLYIPGIFFLSVAIAMGASAAALWMAFTLARHNSPLRNFYQIGAAGIMGLAICGMHYTGMWASVMIPYADCRYDPNQDYTQLAVAVAGITGIILAIALAVGIYRKTQMEIQLQESEAKLRALFDNALDAIITMDEAGRITEWNKQAELTFGWTRDEAVGGVLGDMIVPEEFRERHTAGMAHFLASGDGPILNQRIELEALTKGGARIPIELSVNAQKLQESYQFTAFLRDITTRKKAEENILLYTQALERSNQELDDFAYIASHDLKEPLRGLYNNAAFLIEDYQDKLGEDGAKRLHRLTQLAQRMERLVNDLLYFSRLGRTDMAIKETNPTEMVEDVKQLLEPLLRERNAHIEIATPLPHIICDVPRITEVLRNLITNAVKYNDKAEKRIEVGFLPTADSPQGKERAVFYVKDNGIGIDAQFYTEIFRIFKRLNTTKDDKDSGTGSGLTFVKKIIERHQGHVWVESTVGEGSTFYFTLPQTQRFA